MKTRFYICSRCGGNDPNCPICHEFPTSVDEKYTNHSIALPKYTGPVFPAVNGDLRQILRK